jgi:hypothetical protein
MLERTTCVGRRWGWLLVWRVVAEGAIAFAAAALLLLSCRAAEDLPKTDVEARYEPAAVRPHQPAKPAAPVPAVWLDGAALEASYDTNAVVQLGGSLPRPSERDTPLVGVFAGIVDALRGDPVGLQPDARIHLSIRALDGRGAAVRKLFGELVQDGRPITALDPERVERLTSEARTLGVHLRASLPTNDRAALLRALSLLTVTDGDVGEWARACESLSMVALCSARPRLLLWARIESDERLRVDGIYLFHDGVPAEELARTLERADTWPARADVPEFGEPAPIELRIHAEPTRELLEAEALADAVADFVAPPTAFDYAEYLRQEASLRDLVPSERVFEGVDLDLAYDHADDRLAVDVRWLPSPSPAARGDELFAPVIERGTLPVLEGDCAAAQVCARVGGFAILPRFVDLARGAFADSTGVMRIMRHAGDGATILLGLCSWPNALGTLGVMAASSGGLLDQSTSALLADSEGLGLLALELGDDPELARTSPLGTRFVGYLRVGSHALSAVRQLGMLSGLSLRPIDLEGVDAEVERGSYEDLPVHVVDETSRPGGFGGWVITADADERVGWLLETPREPVEPTALDPISYLQVGSLGPLAAREQLSYADEAPIRAWLDGHGLEVRGRFANGQPIVTIVLFSNSAREAQ